MSFEIIPTENFQKRAKKLLKKYLSLKSELLHLTNLLAENPYLGTPLGDNAYKIRMAVKSKNVGKSGGLRVITYLVLQKERIYLADIYDKSEQSTISNKELSKLIESIERQIKSQKKP